MHTSLLIRGVFLTALLLVAPWPAAAQNVPDTIELNSMVDLYGPVTFDHAMHIDLTGNCTACHHHNADGVVEDENCARCHSAGGSQRVVACSQCHAPEPFSAEAIRQKEANIHLYHRDKPGTKGAFHLNCLGCHEQMGAPTGCQDCHLRTDKGDAFFNAGPYAPAGEAPAHH